MTLRLLLSFAAAFTFAACEHDHSNCSSGETCAEGESCTSCSEDHADEGEDSCTGCVGEEHGEGEQVATSAADIEAALARTDPSGSYGTGLSLTEETPISTILADPNAFEGQRLRVRGEAVGVCAKRGCWIELKSDVPFQSLRVKVTDGEIVFPMSAKGRVVVAEGVLQKIVVPVEDLRKAMAAAAKEKGEAFDESSITEPRIIWQLRGLGASIDA